LQTAQLIEFKVGLVGRMPEENAIALRERGGHRPDVIEEPDGLSAGWQWACFLLAVAALFTRRPDMLLHPQFYAEDGRVWYADAYNLHWLSSLTLQVGGYLNTLPRLVAGLTLLFPFHYAPLIMNLFGIAIGALPVPVVLSARCRTWGTLPMRMVMAAISIAMPSTQEIHVVLTNAQWHFAVLEMLILFAAPPATWLGRLSDILVLGIGSVSGPFPVLMLPLVLIFLWRRRQPWSLVLAGILAVGAGVQVFTYMHAGRQLAGPLGANLQMVPRMIGGDVILCSILGPHNFYKFPWPLLMAPLIFGLIVVVSSLLAARLSLRLLIVFTSAFLVAALHNPAVLADPTKWDSVLRIVNSRYWYYPMLTFLWSATYCGFSAQQRMLRIAGCCVLAALPIGMVDNWRYPPFPDENFSYYARLVEQARPGQRIVIPLFPQGWSMTLVKH